MPREQRRLTVRLARDDRDLAAVQALRWMSSSPRWARRRTTLHTLDTDPYDALCDHLLVIDADEPGTHLAEGGVVGTYRLLRESVAHRAGGFYSAGEFDLSPLMAPGSRPGGELLELGRSCVRPAWRTSATISLLWRGIADYIASHGIGLMFGCASFPGTDPDAHAQALSLLAHTCLAPPNAAPACAGNSGPTRRSRSNASHGAATTNAARCCACRHWSKAICGAAPCLATAPSSTMHSTRSMSAWSCRSNRSPSATPPASAWPPEAPHAKFVLARLPAQT
jgi:hypothetical protein